MTMFDQREKAFEAKFQLDQEVGFKVNIRSDKLLGLWAAERLGLNGDAAKAYALSVVDAEFSTPDHNVCRKVAADLTRHGLPFDEQAVAQEKARCHSEAVRQINDETSMTRG